MAVYFSLTVASLVQMGDKEKITITDTDGQKHEIARNILSWIFGLAWAAFALSLILNIIYYLLHPSRVTTPLKTFLSEDY